MRDSNFGSMFSKCKTWAGNILPEFENGEKENKEIGNACITEWGYL